MMKLSGIWQTQGWRRVDRLVGNRMLCIEIQIQLQNIDARLVSQARHLRQIAHRGLWHIGLPVGVGGKGNGGVPRKIREAPLKSSIAVPYSVQPISSVSSTPHSR